MQFSGQGNYCNDCGEKIGFYPERHACKQQQQQHYHDSAVVPLPPPKDDAEKKLRVTRKPLPSKTNSNPKMRPTLPSSLPSDSSDSQTRRSTPRSGSLQTDDTQTASREEGSIYYSNYAVHLQSSSDTSSTKTAKKKLWKKVRNNEKFKEFSSKVDMARPNTKLWGKFIKSMADKIPTREDRGPESDASDWEGETHVSRVLREYYEKKQRALPYWMYDDKRSGPKKSLSMLAKNESAASRKQRLWERDPVEQPRQQQQQQQRLVLSLNDDLHDRRPKARYTTTKDYDRAPLPANPQSPAGRHSIYNLTPSNVQYNQQQQQRQHPPLQPNARHSTGAYVQQTSAPFMQHQQQPAHWTASGNQDNGNTNPFENTDDMSSRIRVRGPRDAPAFQTRYTTTTAGSYM